jgi:signal transduction histidine kinase
MVSHEFRTPLGIIQSSVELLRDFFSENGAYRTHRTVGRDQDVHRQSWD